MPNPSTSQRTARDVIIREQVLAHLGDVVQSLLQPAGDTRKLYVRTLPKMGTLNPNYYEYPSRPKVFGPSDLTNTLCSSLEAVLIHGIKDSYSSRMSSFFGSDPNRMPVPNFWPVVMSVSHKDDIKEVCSLPFITSDVGRGRAWLRLVINGDKLSSYMDAITREAGFLKDYYRTSALLRCPENCSQFLGALRPLNNMAFELATNSAMLNTWTQTPLVLSGLWAPVEGHTVRGWAQPIGRGIDVVSNLPEDQHDPAHDRQLVFIEETPFNDHLFNAILAATPTTNFIGTIAATDTETKTPRNKPLVVRTLHPDTDVEGNDIVHSDGGVNEVGVGRPFEDEDGDVTDDELVAINTTVKQDETDSLVGSYVMKRTGSDDGSTVTSASSMDYNTLISRRLDNVDYRYVNTDGLYDGALPEESSSNGSDDSDSVNSQGFEMVHGDSATVQVTRLSSLVSRLCPQTGLDEQKYQCYQCRAFIGLFYGEFKACAMDGKSYCLNCHNNATSIVPARVLYNWDLRQHFVSETNKQWLEKHHDSPMLDIRATNPKLYEHVEELRQLKNLRTQLSYLRAYLFTCSPLGVGEVLRKMIHPREHLYDHVHLYSVADLLLVSRGGLVSDVQDAVCFARLHIRDCRKCIARGFCCEVCKKHEVIFPFQLDIAQTCPECCAVYHRTCTRHITQCPRCVRRKKRKLLQQQQQLQIDDCVEST